MKKQYMLINYDKALTMVIKDTSILKLRIMTAIGKIVINKSFNFGKNKTSSPKCN